MRVILLVGVVIFHGYHAFAQCPNDPKVDKEARSYLVPCTYPKGSDEQRLCPGRQAEFLKSYQRAKAGSHWAQHDMAGTFMQGVLGVAKNPVQGCAWELAAALADLAHADPDEVDMAVRYCDVIGPSAFALAKARAQQIITEMQSSGAVEWDGMDDPCADDN